MLERHFFYKRTRNSKTTRKNCFWVKYKENYFLISYRTVVCCVTKDGSFIKFWDNWSLTTQNQINCFINELLSDNLVNCVKNPDNGSNICGFGKKEWLDYKLSDNSSVAAEIVQTIPEIEWYYYAGGQSVRKITYRG